MVAICPSQNFLSEKKSLLILHTESQINESRAKKKFRVQEKGAASLRPLFLIRRAKGICAAVITKRRA
jgi:hypothetical protein